MGKDLCANMGMRPPTRRTTSLPTCLANAFLLWGVAFQPVPTGCADRLLATVIQ